LKKPQDVKIAHIAESLYVMLQLFACYNLLVCVSFILIYGYEPGNTYGFCHTANGNLIEDEFNTYKNFRGSSFSV